MPGDSPIGKWQISQSTTAHLRSVLLTFLFLSLALYTSLLISPAVPAGYITMLTAACGVSGWFGGRIYGAGCGSLASLCVNYFFLAPIGSLQVDKELQPSSLAFLLGALAAGWISGEWRRSRNRLRESREQFRLLLGGVKDHAIFLLDADGRVATWNSGAQRIKGYQEAEILGKHHSVFYPADEVAQRKPQELLQKAAAQGSVRSEGFRVRKDGTQFWAEVTITALYENDGRIRGYAKTTKDVSELRANRDALEAKEEELRAVVEYSPDAFLMVNEGGSILFANNGAATMFGYPLSELIGTKVERLVPVSKRGSHAAHRERYQQKPHRRPMGMGFELFAVRKDGSEFPVEISLGPVESSLERRFIASVRDITERRLMEHELQDRKIQELAQLMIRDLDGRIVHWNDGMTRLYGYSRAEAEGIISHDLLRTIFARPLQQIDAELLRTGYWEGELVHHRKDGQLIYVNSLWVLHRDKDGKPSRVLESSIDVTALKRAEEKALKLNRELEKQNADLSLAKAVIEAQTQRIAVGAKMSALGEMAGGMAHEINNPMGIIHARASDLMEFAEEAEAVPSRTVIETMEKIRNTAARVTKITLGLRKFARETRNDPLVEVSVAELVEDTLSFCMQRLKQASIDLRLPSIPAGLRVGCKPTEISQVLLNLLNNSIDAVHSLPEKWIELSVERAGDSLEISITDSGAGIPVNIREKMGQPFFTTKEVGKGTGLGLSISRGIVEAHGGQLRVDAECLHTRFVVALPISATKRREAVPAGR